MTVSPTDKALYILKKRYFQKDENWEGLCNRVAKAAASIEETSDLKKEWQKKFFDHMSNLQFLPASPALFNLGADHKGCAAACFALRPEDSMESILEVGRLASMTLKFGGGVGFELSALRPAGALVQSTHKAAMGPVGVLKYYGACGKLVTQGGKRDAALLGLLKITHPDIVQFITAKEQDGDLYNFNISVSVPDAFMKRLSEKPEAPHIASFGGKQYHILPSGEAILRGNRGAAEVLSVQDLWEIICKRTADNGEPGLFFVDTVNKNNPLIKGLSDTDNPMFLHGCNPCGELPLESKSACVLISVNLEKFVKDKELDTSNLYEAFSVATRFAENMIDATVWPDLSIEERVKAVRRIGIGLMGYTSTLDLLGIQYGSTKALEVIETIGNIRQVATSKMSEQLAKERGVYPSALEGETHRHVTRQTIAPTGSLAQLANTSWSIEPHFFYANYDRRMGEETFEFSTVAKKFLSEERLIDLQELAAGDFKLLNELISKELPSHITTWWDIQPKEYIDTVSAWQKYTDNAVSNTVNLFGESTPELIDDLYRYAWEKKLKGITIYPTGSRKGEPMGITTVKKRKRIDRPEVLDAKSIAVQFQLNGDRPLKAYATISFFPESEEMFEIMIKHPSTIDQTGTQFIDLTTRLLSLVLRYRNCPSCGEEAVPLGEVIEQLRKTDGSVLYSVPSILAKALARYIPKDEPVGTCPDCGGYLTIIEGCFHCSSSCGFSLCS